MGQAEPRSIMPKVTLLNGEVRLLAACRTVNDMKVRACQLFPGALPPEVCISANGVVLEETAEAPNHSSAVLCSRDKSEKSLWGEAFVAYAEFGDHTGASQCIQKLKELEPSFTKRALMNAVDESKYQLARALIVGKADVNIAYDGNTPLILSVQKGDLEMVTALLGAKADVRQVCGRTGATPLAKCALYGHTSTCRALVAAGADINYGAFDGFTPVAHSVMDGHTTTCVFFLDAGADVNLADEMGYTPLARSASMGHLDIVLRLIAAKADINKRDKGGWTSLLYSARKGHTAIVSALIDAGADINQLIAKINQSDFPDGFQRYTNTTVGLRGVFKYSHYGGDWNVFDDSEVGQSPLILSAAAGHEATVARILDAGASANQAFDQRHQNGSTPLCISARNGHIEVVKKLIDAEADVNVADNDGFTALMLSADEGHGDIVKELLAADADIARTCDHGSTALSMAAQIGSKNIVALLVRAGASLDTVDKDGDTIVACAVAGGPKNADMVEYLLSMGAPIGKTALVKAVKSGDVDIVKLLLARDATLITEQVAEKSALEWSLLQIGKDIHEGDDNNDKNGVDEGGADDNMDKDDDDDENTGGDDENAGDDDADENTDDDDDSENDDDVPVEVRKEIVDVLREATRKKIRDNSG